MGYSTLVLMEAGKLHGTIPTDHAVTRLQTATVRDGETFGYSLSAAHFLSHTQTFYLPAQPSAIAPWSPARNSTSSQNNASTEGQIPAMPQTQFGSCSLLVSALSSE